MTWTDIPIPGLILIGFLAVLGLYYLVTAILGWAIKKIDVSPESPPPTKWKPKTVELDFPIFVTCPNCGGQSPLVKYDEGSEEISVEYVCRDCAFRQWKTKRR